MACLISLVASRTATAQHDDLEGAVQEFSDKFRYCSFDFTKEVYLDVSPKKLIEMHRGTQIIGDGFLRIMVDKVTKSDRVASSPVRAERRESALLDDGGVISFATDYTPAKEVNRISKASFSLFDGDAHPPMGHFDRDGEAMIDNLGLIAFGELFSQCDLLKEVRTKRPTLGEFRTVTVDDLSESVRCAKFQIESDSLGPEIEIGIDRSGRLVYANYVRLYNIDTSGWPYKPDPTSIAKKSVVSELIAYRSEDAFSYRAERATEFQSGSRKYVDRMEISDFRSPPAAVSGLSGDYPNRTEVLVKGEPQIRHLWVDGQVVPATGILALGRLGGLANFLGAPLSLALIAVPFLLAVAIFVRRRRS